MIGEAVDCSRSATTGSKQALRATLQLRAIGR